MYAFIFIWRAVFRLSKPSQLGAGICFGPEAPIGGTLIFEEAGTGVWDWDYSCGVLFGRISLSDNCATVKAVG